MWGIYIHEPDGDMGDGMIIGPMAVENADKKVEKIKELFGENDAKAPNRIECIVIPMVKPGQASLEYIKQYFEEL